MSLAVITVNNQSPALDHKASEVALVARALQVAAQQIRAAGGAATSGTMTGDFGAVLGTWTYTPQASS
jgi:hypothetical protein